MQLQVIMKQTNSLIPYAMNARTHNEIQISQIAASIKEFGFNNPVLVDSKNGIIAGHGRVLAAQKIGLLEVPTICLPHLTDDQRRAFVLADNKIAINAGWDDAMLANELKHLDEIGFDTSLIGFDDKEISRALAELDQNSDVDADPQEAIADELQKKYGVERGQTWKLGEHTILCGDSTKPDDVSSIMAGNKATLVFTDPPYGVSIGEKNRMLNSLQESGRNLTDIVSDDMKSEDLKPILTAAFRETRKICADDCSVFVCSPQGGQLGMMMMMMMKESGMEVRHVLNWAKNSPTFSMGRLDYDYQHEPILFTWIKTHKRIMAGKFKTSLWSVNKPRACKEHPTMKPVELPENAILNHTDRGDIVYEPFSGSGTTLIACERTGRRCRAIEIAPGYVAVAIQRWFDATGKTPERIK